VFSIYVHDRSSLRVTVSGVTRGNVFSVDNSGTGKTSGEKRGGASVCKRNTRVCPPRPAVSRIRIAAVD